MCEGPTLQALIGYHKEDLPFQLLMHLSQASHTFASHHSMSICCKRISVSLAPWSSDFVMIFPWYFRILNAGSRPRPGSDSPLLETGTTQLFQIWRCLEQGKLPLQSFNANSILLSLCSEIAVTWPQTQTVWDHHSNNKRTKCVLYFLSLILYH